MTPSPVECIMAHMRAIEEAVEKIKNAHEEHFKIDPENVNWGHAGYVKDIALALERVVDMLECEHD